jgi:hypothetical protein
MMLREGDIEIDFSKADSAKRFDDVNHGLSHCMKAVDFVIEFQDRILFIEVKDPQNPKAKPKQVQEFIDGLQSNKLVNDVLTSKCRDSFLYEQAMGNLTKPVYYLILVGLDSLTEADLSHQTDLLRRQIPVDGPVGNPWPNKFIHGCAIFNLYTWKSNLPQFPVSRITQA